MKVNTILIVMILITGYGYGQNIGQVTTRDTMIFSYDTTHLDTSEKLKVGLIRKKNYSYNATAGDTILYSIKKENLNPMKYKIIKPNDDKKEYDLAEDVVNQLLEVDSTGQYTFQFKNKSIKRNKVVVTLKGVNKVGHIQQIPVDPVPIIDTLWTVIHDTVPQLIFEETFYVGAKKNIRAEYEIMTSYEFADSVPCHWSYVVGFGKDYGETLGTLIDLKTQEPIGDPLIAYYAQGFNSFPESQSQRARLNLKGPIVNKNISRTAVGTYKADKGVYQLTLSNKDEVVGEYVYFKVMGFYYEPKSEEFELIERDRDKTYPKYVDNCKGKSQHVKEYGETELRN